MLYPNFASGHSLSTNHLEVGAHVQVVPDASAGAAAAHARRKQLFNVPLMSLPTLAVDDERTVPSTGLLDMPNKQLPAWPELPIFDLIGEVVDEQTIVQRGHLRRAELTGCTMAADLPYDVDDLLCIE